MIPASTPALDRLSETPWRALAETVAERFRRRGIKFTLGGEPTYVPLQPEGAEWNIAAVGPTKLGYAYTLADALIEQFVPGAITVFSPGKRYPGEVNPRWVVNVLANRDGTPIAPKAAAARRSGTKALKAFRADLGAALGLPPESWQRAKDPLDPSRPAYILPLDHDGERWITQPWKLLRGGATLPLVAAEGPIGLRLPLDQLAPDVLRRALTLEWLDGRAHLFLPPLMQEPFKSLLGVMTDLLAKHRLPHRLEGYLPADEDQSWMRLGLTADPGVLEVNLPACASWEEYHRWFSALEIGCAASGLRSWKEHPQGGESGTGGGNHLLFGGPSLEENAFFTRPRWVASLLRHFQAYPCLAYLFTGSYVGSSSQAPRPDESARDLYDLDLAYSYLASLPDGEDQRYFIGETLRHLHIDNTGNSHRSESSFDKFWNVGGPAGAAAGLIEFRAIESMPRAAWMSLVALLWQAVAAHTLDHPVTTPLVKFGTKLHDQFFLPTPLWSDLCRMLGELRAGGLDFPDEAFRPIWQWRFPTMLSADLGGGATLEVRRACEEWPLLCETPSEGGSTSRFVDASMERLEISASAEFARAHRLFANGRELALMPLAENRPGCGLRYRRSALYPSLHPGIKPHLPLELTVIARDRGDDAQPVAVYVLDGESRRFVTKDQPAHDRRELKPAMKSDSTPLTYDLRLG